MDSFRQVFDKRKAVIIPCFWEKSEKFAENTAFPYKVSGRVGLVIP